MKKVDSSNLARILDSSFNKRQIIRGKSTQRIEKVSIDDRLLKTS